MNNARWQNTDQTIASGSSPISVMRKQPLISMQSPQLSSQAEWTLIGLLVVFALVLIIFFWRRTRTRKG